MTSPIPPMTSATLPPEAEKDALKLATHRHYKGGLYRFICDSTHSETGETMVVYEHLWPFERAVWVRPSVLFYGQLEDGSRRFTPCAVTQDQVLPD